MGFLLALVVGGIVGWLASVLMKADRQMGVLANVVVGVVGSALGHLLAGLIGIAAYGELGSLLISTIGAMLLIALLRRLGLFR